MTVFGSAARGIAAATGVALLTWPVVDRVGLPCIVRRSIARSEGRTEKMSDLAKWVAEMRNKYSTDRSGVWLFLQLPDAQLHQLSNEISGTTANITIEGIADSRLLLYGVLGRICEPLGSLGKVSEAYIRALNVFGDIVTSNNRHDHTTFMFYNLLLDHVRRGLENHQKTTGKRPLVVVTSFNEFCKDSSTDTTQHRVMVNSTQRVLRWLQERGVIDVVVIADITKTFAHCDDISAKPDAFNWIQGTNTLPFWVRPSKTTYQRCLHYPYENLKFHLSEFYCREPKGGYAHKKLCPQQEKVVTQMLEDNVLHRVVGTELFADDEHNAHHALKFIPGEKLQSLQPQVGTLRWLYHYKLTLLLLHCFCVLPITAFASRILPS
eukprot:TRINITY_DN7363_c1_g1_i1.p1 TRINITY_DN7363_c1_g1~~TRINITY_DN7363_c1_g1_i1.p1  ORF type:complete len:379 (+),score=49.14 TRINITY_DN7363_c1_g1_i1:78-1214(+)